MAELTFELVAPEKLLVSQTVQSVRVPGTEGDMGIMAGHAPLISGLREGVVKVNSAEGAAVTSYFVAGGFIEVTDGRCTVLAEEAVALSDLNASSLSDELAKAKTELAVEPSDSSHRLALLKRITRLEAKLAALGTRH